MARIPLISSDDELSPRQRAVVQTILSGARTEIVGPLRAALHAPDLAERWQAFGEYLRFRTCLPPALSELAIIAVARHWNSEVEWFVHAEAARLAGLTSDIIDAIGHAQSPHLASPEQARVYAFTRELLEDGAVTDTTYADLQADHAPAALVELVALIGYYSMVAMTLNAHHIPVPNRAGYLLPVIAGAGRTKLAPCLMSA